MPLGANKAAIMGVAGVSTGDVVLISSQTASGDASLDFTSGITATYGEYIFKFYNINPATDSAYFQFQANASGQSGYNETISSSAFLNQERESDGAASFGYHTGFDQAQATGFQYLMNDMANDADQGGAGWLHLFNPSSTTYVKHFYAQSSHSQAADYQETLLIAGYFNFTAALTNVQFKMNSGNFDGTIKMWGVK